MPKGSSRLPIQPLRRIDGGQRDAGDGGRQREGQIDDGIEQAPAGKAIADQHPGDDDAEDDVDRGGDEGDDEAHAQAPRACAAR